MTTKTTGTLIVVVLVAMSIFVSLSTLAGQVADSDVPPILFPVWSYIKAFFALASVTTAIGFIVNISGYLKNYFQTNHTETYDFDKLAKTLTVYAGIITSLLAAITPLQALVASPYNEYLSAALAIGAVIIVVLNLIKSNLADLISYVAG